MKRAASVFLLIVLLLCGAFSASVFAASRTYDLGECGICISIPEEYIVITRDVEEDDPNLELLGFERDEFLEMMQEQDLYLSALEWDKSYEVLLAVEPQEWEGLENATDEVLQEYLEFTKNQNEKMGNGWISGEVYQHSQLSFIKTLISRSGYSGTEYYLQYYGIKGGQAIRFAAISYGAGFPQEDIAVMDGIVDTISIEDTAQPPVIFEGAVVSEPETPQELDLGALLINLIAVVMLYTLPIVIYRYAVLRNPVGRKKAKRIVWICGIAVFVVLSVLISLLGGSGVTNGVLIFLWGFINYSLLIGGGEEELSARPETVQPPKPQCGDACVQGPDEGTAQAAAAAGEGTEGPQETAAPGAVREQYCRKCGAKLPEDAQFCIYCGAPTLQNGKQGGE